MFLAKVFYFCQSGGLAFVLPYFNLYFERFMTREQIGLISALRPWLSAPASVLLTHLADRFRIHAPLLAVTFTACVMLRCLLLILPRHFAPVALVVLLAECIGAPVGAIVDATVVAAVNSEYGKHRMWGSIGWGALSVMAGWLVAHKGLEAGYMVYILLSVPCVFIALKLQGEGAAAAAAACGGNSNIHEHQQVPCEAAGDDMQVMQHSREHTQSFRQRRSLCTSAAGSGSAAITPVDLACPGNIHNTEDLQMRLLPSTPNSLAGSCPNSLQCSPEPCSRPESPFSFQQSTTAFSARTNPNSNSSGGGKTEAEAEAEAEQSATATADMGLIKAWYNVSDETPHEPSIPPCGLLSRDNMTLAVTGKEKGQQVTLPPPLPPLLEPQQGCDEALAPGMVAGGNTKQSAKLEKLASLQQADHELGSISQVAATGFREKDEHEESPLLAAGSSKQQLSTVTVQPGHGSSRAKGQQASSISGLLLKQPAALLLLWRATVIGLGLGTIGSFVFLHVEELGGTPSLFGLMLAFNILTEAPAFAFQSKVLETLSVPFVFNASMVLLALRLAGYAVLPLLHNPWLVLGLELMHGFTFATSWGAGIVYCKHLVPAELNASMQGLFASVYGGVGSGLGALLGGFLMEHLGGQQLFMIMSLVVLGGWAVGLAVELVVRCPSLQQ